MLRLDGIVRCATLCLVAAGVCSSVAGGTARAECAATPVRNDKVKVGPFTGGIAPQYDVVGGRFRLHVGPYRDETTGLTQKIPWFVKYEDRARVGNTIQLKGTRLHPAPARVFKQLFYGAGNGNAVFPSIIVPPSSGCWRLTFHSGRVSPSLTVLVSPLP